MINVYIVLKESMGILSILLDVRKKIPPKKLTLDPCTINSNTSTEAKIHNLEVNGTILNRCRRKFCCAKLRQCFGPMAQRLARGTHNP